jgi:hypothetical protein
MVAFATTAPLASFTVPVMLPPVPAQAMAWKKKIANVNRMCLGKGRVLYGPREVKYA